MPARKPRYYSTTILLKRMEARKITRLAIVKAANATATPGEHLLSTSTVNRVLDGQNTRIGTLQKIVRVLGLSMKDVISD